MICVVGADGFFGTYLQKYILSLPSHEHLVCLNHSSVFLPEADNKTDTRFELNDKDSIKKAVSLLSQFDDIKIIFLAAVHNPDIVKKAPQEAEFINTVCYENFLNELSGLNIKRLIYSSSDTVYGESINGHIFTEKDDTAPINIYGRQKLLAENITRKHGYTVSRYSYMCAPSLNADKKHFYDEVAKTLKNGEQVFMLTDWVRSALSYSTAAEITYKLALSDTKEPVINICSDEAVSKYEIGLRIAKTVGAKSSLVVPCTKKELGIFTEKRADDIIMSNALSKKLGIAKNTGLTF